MLCLNCNTKYDRYQALKKCPNCGIDILLQKRTKDLSIRLYNQGLERLKANDLTHGIKNLTKSVAVDKSNVTARNLLGLALFQVGHAGEALMHWSISKSMQDVDNPAERYLQQVSKNTKNLERYNDAINMYNRALGHIKQKSDDLAIIQLKKAVENNPNFVDAQNLLALCNLIQNEKDRALLAVEKVLSLDAQNPIALSHISVINPKAKPTRPSTGLTKSLPKTAGGFKSPYKPISIEEKKSSNFHIAEILTFVIGAISALAIGYFLLFPAFVREHESEIAEINQATQALTADHQAELENAQRAHATLESTIQDQQNTIAAFEAAAELQERINAVYHAYWLYQDNHMEDAMDILDNLNTDGMSFDVRNRIETIREGAYPALAAYHGNEGNRLFSAGEYDAALVRLELADRFMSQDMTPLRRDFMFSLGSIYYQQGRLEEAYELLTTLRANFSQHRPIGVGNLIRSIENQLAEDN